MQNYLFKQIRHGISMAAIGVLVGTCQSGLHADDANTKRVTILTWNASTAAEASLQSNGDLVVGGRPVKSACGGFSTGAQNFSIVNDPASSSGKVIHYFLGPQGDGAKSWVVHYLHVEPLKTTFYSEFSIKLDPDFTEVNATRPDSGVNWCSLRDWRQGVPKPSIIGLDIRPGSNNIIHWNITGDDGTGHGKTTTLGEKQIELDHWYHFKVQWNISPDENGQFIVMMSDTKLPKCLGDSDILFNYRGSIGYKVDGQADADTTIDTQINGPFTVREEQGIAQGPHTDPASRHGYSIDNLNIYTIPAN